MFGWLRIGASAFDGNARKAQQQAKITESLENYCRVLEAENRQLKSDLRQRDEKYYGGDKWTENEINTVEIKCRLPKPGIGFAGE